MPGWKCQALDVKIKMLYGDDRQSIIGQYVRFCKVFDTQMTRLGNTAEAVAETIRICKDEDVLKTYLTTHEQEAASIMMALFDEDYIQRAYGRECELRGEARGRAYGQTLFARLIQRLIADGKTEEIQKVADDPAYRQNAWSTTVCFPQIDPTSNVPRILHSLIVFTPAADQINTAAGVIIRRPPNMLCCSSWTARMIT